MSEPSFAEVLEACTARCREMDAPLTDRLAAFAADVKRLSPEFTDIVERMVAGLNESGAGANAPAVGEAMPPFVLPDDAGRIVSLEELLRSGQVVVSFHRGHWCPYCRINADALARIEPQISAAGAQIVAITPEVQKFASELKAESAATFPILTDLDSGYALELQLAIRINDEKRQAMTKSGWDIANYQDNDSWTLPIPATFVVGRDGVIKARYVDPDYRKRMDIEAILTALAA